MINIKWCLKQRRGIKIVEPNQNISNSYMKMAEESLKIIQKMKESTIWFASSTYYTMYYCLYAVLIRFGIKSEIHSCSIKVMKDILTEFYNSKNVFFIEEAFKMRQNTQYYPNKKIDIIKLKVISSQVPDFVIKTKEILSSISETQIEKTRKEIISI